MIFGLQFSANECVNKNLFSLFCRHKGPRHVGRKAHIHTIFGEVNKSSYFMVFFGHFGHHASLQLLFAFELFTLPF